MKQIVITGTRKGIGRSLAEYYLAEGWGVIGCSRGEASIEHAQYQHCSVDVSDEYTTRRTTALAMDRGVSCESLEPPGREPPHGNSSTGRTRRKTGL